MSRELKCNNSRDVIVINGIEHLIPGLCDIEYDANGQQILKVIRGLPISDGNRLLGRISISYVRKAIVGTKGNKTLLAKKLDISRSSLYKYLRLHPELEDDIKREKVPTS